MTTNKTRKTHPCDGCGNDVQARRTSLSGEHWCQQPNCQAAKQRLIRARRRAAIQGESPDVEQARFDYFVAALARRRRCDLCDLEDAVPGFAHRGIDGSPCFGVGNGGGTIGVHYIDAVHPARKPRPSDEVA